MRRHARSENRKIVYEEGEEEGAAEIGSRVFPFRTPPPTPASMPSVGTRRSTRVFVPKQRSSDGESTRVLRSGKRLSLSKAKTDGNEWLRVLGSAAGAGDASDLRWWKKGENGWKDDVVEEPTAEAIGGKKFGTVYSRKRRRSECDDLKDRKYGIVFSRKQHKKDTKVTPLVDQASRETSRRIDREFIEKLGISEQLSRDSEHEDGSRRAGTRSRQLRIPESSWNFVETVGIAEGDIWMGPGAGSLLLAVLVESSCSYSSCRFARLVLPIMNWMRRARVRLWDLAAFLLSGSLARIFSLNGIHFLPVRHQKDNVLVRNSISGYGSCKIYGAREFVPLLSLDFSALPSYFKSLHATIVLGSHYLPSVLRTKHSMGLHESFFAVVLCEEYDHNIFSESGFSGTEVTVSETPALKRNKLPSVVEAPASVAQNSVIVNGSRLRKHQRKRSSLRNSRARNPSRDSHFSSFRADQNSVRVFSAAECGSLVEPFHVKPLDPCLAGLFNGREENGIASPPQSHLKQKKSARKSPIDQIKELKSALAEVRQNIESAHCNANILVTVADRCWREDGAEVMLELSDSNEWCIVVKRGGVMRYLHKPQDMRQCVVNRYTHAYMWSGEDGWKLEFFDKWDWRVFKELHMECRERNTQDVSLRIIPVPGVREVSGYEDVATPSFARPDMYIHTMDDEVGRALASKTAYYDMDSADEEWFRHLNSSSSDAEDGGSSCISEDNFERIIFALEKDAYNCPDDASDKQRALDLCQVLGKRDVVAAVYDYWLKKRKQKRAALVKVFQGPPLRRAQLIQKSFLRKKRSFKRQRSQAGRGKPDFFLQAGIKQEALRRLHAAAAGAKQEALRRVQEAESAATRAAETAIHLRTRAQVLMANADLAAYRSVMALRIAEIIRASSSEGSPDLDSFILFN